MKRILKSLVLMLVMLMVPAAAVAQNMYADVNGDLEVNIADINAVIGVILSDVNNPSADVNGDGEVNIADINAVIDIILGGGIDPFLEVCKKVSDIDYEIKDYYKNCSSLEELKEYADVILAIDGVEDVYFNEHTTMFVEIKGFPTISYSYYPKANVAMQQQMLRQMKANIEASLQDDNTIYTHQQKNDKVILIVNQQSWEDRPFQNEQMIPGLHERFWKAGYKCPIINNSPDVEFFRNGIFDCDYLFLLTHGKYDPKKKLHWLATSEEILYNNKGKIDPTFLQKYKDFKNGEQVGFDMEAEGHDVVCVSEKFIETSTKQFYHPGQAIVFNTACESLKGPNPNTNDSINYDLALAFRQKGAATYLGYDETSTAGQSAGFEFFERLLSGMSVESAFDDLSFVSRHNRMPGEKGDFWADLKCTVKTETCINQPEIAFVDLSDDDGLRIDLYARNFFERFIAWQEETINPETGVYDIKQDFIVSNDELQKLPFRYGFELSESEQFTEMIPLGEKRIGDEGCTWDEYYGILDGSNFYYMLELSQSLTYSAGQADSKIKPNTTYWVRAYIYDGQGYNYSEPITFTTGSIAGDTPDHEWVDLGLPSGTLWATCNVGASAPEEYGDYFAWGETEPKEVYSWETYKWCNGFNNTLTKYNTKSSYGTVDNKTELELEDDAAYVNWGPQWRMPTDDQLLELRKKCTWELTTRNGVSGRLVTGPNGNSLFLPAAGYFFNDWLDGVGFRGYFWPCTLYSDAPDSAYFVGFNTTGYTHFYNERCAGFSVRAVRVP